MIDDDVRGDCPTHLSTNMHQRRCEGLGCHLHGIVERPDDSESSTSRYLAMSPPCKTAHPDSPQSSSKAIRQPRESSTTRSSEFHHHDRLAGSQDGRRSCNIRLDERSSRAMVEIAGEDVLRVDNVSVDLTIVFGVAVEKTNK
jgi:hypothetical protein